MNETHRQVLRQLIEDVKSDGSGIFLAGYLDAVLDGSENEAVKLEVSGAPVMPPYPLVEVMPEFAERVIETGRKKPKCSFCGNTGHQVRTCVGARVTSREYGGNAPIPDGDEGSPVTPDEPLSEEEFDYVKKAKNDGGTSSREVAQELAVPIKEVNAAWSVPDYDYYIEHRV